MDSAALAATLDSAGAPFAPANALTSQREMFCRVYVACGNAAEAARQAGYAADSARQQGHRLLADDTIKHRIQALWAAAEAARTADRDRLIDKTERLFDAAMETKSFNAAARALGLQARIAGFTGPARDREEVVPGRPGPVVRAEMRKAAREQQEEPEARPGDGAAAEDGGTPPEVGEPSTGPHPRPSAPTAERRRMKSSRQPEASPPAAGADATPGPDRDTPAGTANTPPSRQQPPAADPWAEAARIERERELAGLHATLSGQRRRAHFASEAALAARDAADRAA